MAEADIEPLRPFFGLEFVGARGLIGERGARFLRVGAGRRASSGKSHSGRFSARIKSVSDLEVAL